jgi:hypothetical protein
METPKPSNSNDRAREPNQAGEVARGHLSNRERPEQPASRAQAVDERRRTGKHPVGEKQAETNRTEESQS